MQRRSRSRSSPFAQIGFFALATIAVAFATFYILTNFASGHGRYRIGVRFIRAAGISQGAQVFFSGVDVGTVDEIRLLPDNTVDLILAINNDTNIPKSSKFSIRPALTGSPTVIINAPISSTPIPANALLAKRILPPSEQPVGTNPVGLEDLMTQGKRLALGTSNIIHSSQGYTRRIFRDLQDSRANAMGTSVQLHAFLADAQASIPSKIKRLQDNLSEATQALRRRDVKKLAALAPSLQTSAASLNSSLIGLKTTTADPQIKANVQISASQIRVAMSNLRMLNRQLAGLSTDRQIRLDLADAAVQLRAAIQKISSFLKGSGT